MPNGITLHVKHLGAINHNFKPKNLLFPAILLCLGIYVLFLWLDLHSQLYYFYCLWGSHFYNHVCPSFSSLPAPDAQFLFVVKSKEMIMKSVTSHFWNSLWRRGRNDFSVSSLLPRKLWIGKLHPDVSGVLMCNMVSSITYQPANKIPNNQWHKLVVKSQVRS